MGRIVDKSVRQIVIITSVINTRVFVLKDVYQDTYYHIVEKVRYVFTNYEKIKYIWFKLYHIFNTIILVIILRVTIILSSLHYITSSY